MAYTEILTSIVEAHNQRHSDTMTVRLLLSIDRSKSVDENAEILDIAVRMISKSSMIVGIDFSGNPNNGRFTDFVSMLQICRDIGLFITVHAAEIHESRKSHIIPISDIKVELDVAVDADISEMLTLSEPTFETSEADDIITFRYDFLLE